LRSRDTAATLTAGSPPLLVFDFDGVLCDSLEECMMVAWYAHAAEPIERFLEPGMAGVPDDVVERFAGCRPFMRHLAHFLVPLVDGDLPTTHAEFAARFDALPDEQADRFATAAEGYRARLRAEHPEPWRARHTVDVRLGALVRDGYVATARDRASVEQILHVRGIDVRADRVFGSLRDKTRALETIAAREGRAPLDVVLVDDSVENCIAARDAGYAAYWASWGYHADGDASTATAHGIPAVTVEALLRVSSESPS
jgi:phosphoglycolate phosphatase-like HAD superfamily hydrolase